MRKISRISQPWVEENPLQVWPLGEIVVTVGREDQDLFTARVLGELRIFAQQQSYTEKGSG
jgi:hypothetical protein